MKSDSQKNMQDSFRAMTDIEYPFKKHQAKDWTALFFTQENLIDTFVANKIFSPEMAVALCWGIGIETKRRIGADTNHPLTPEQALLDTVKKLRAISKIAPNDKQKVDHISRVAKRLYSQHIYLQNYLRETMHDYLDGEQLFFRDTQELINLTKKYNGFLPLGLVAGGMQSGHSITIVQCDEPNLSKFRILDTNQGATEPLSADQTIILLNETRDYYKKLYGIDRFIIDHYMLGKQSIEEIENKENVKRTVEAARKNQNQNSRKVLLPFERMQQIKNIKYLFSKDSKHYAKPNHVIRMLEGISPINPHLEKDYDYKTMVGDLTPNLFKYIVFKYLMDKKIKPDIRALNRLRKFINDPIAFKEIIDQIERDDIPRIERIIESQDIVSTPILIAYLADKIIEGEESNKIPFFSMTASVKRSNPFTIEECRELISLDSKKGHEFVLKSLWRLHKENPRLFSNLAAALDTTGAIDKIRQILANKPVNTNDLLTQDQRGKTPLHYALELRQEDLAIRIINLLSDEQIASLETSNSLIDSFVFVSNKERLLQSAITSEQIKTADALIAKTRSEQFFVVDDNGKNLIEVAIKNKNEKAALGMMAKLSDEQIISLKSSLLNLSKLHSCPKIEEHVQKRTMATSSFLQSAWYYTSAVTTGLGYLTSTALSSGATSAANPNIIPEIRQVTESHKQLQSNHNPTAQSRDIF
jgi:hypothetical protein